MLSSPPHRRRGFTLVELLVVVGILGILVGVSLPSYLNASRSARTNVADGNARALAEAVQSGALRSGAYAASLNDAGVVADMGGNIPNNPCSANAGSAGYGYVADGNGVRISAGSDACPGYAPTTFALSL